MLQLLTFLFLTFYLSVTAQAPVEKWGNPSKEELTMAYCTLDPSASAAILGNYGHYYFNRHFYFSANELRTFYHYQVRLKVFTDEGKKYATVSIPYRGFDDYEDVIEISGATYNLEGGKIVKTKLKPKNIKWTKDKKEQWNCTFTMPEVKPGSVIEYTYKIASLDFAKLRDWMFQGEIPVLYSNLKFTSPNFFQFAFFSNMPKAYLDLKRSEVAEHLLFYNTSVYVNCNVLQISARNIPAFHREVLMPDSSRQILKGELLLSLAITRPTEFNQFNNYYLEPYLKPLLVTTTQNLYELKQRFLLYNEIQAGYKIIEGMEWKDFVKQLSREPDFSKSMMRAFDENQFLIDSLRKIPAREKRMVAAYDYIRRNIKWNGQYRILSSNSMEKIFEKKTGYSSDINMLLLNTLNRVGIQARPVLVSTRSFGNVYKELGFLRKFNHIVISADIEGKKYLLDATDPLRPYDILSEDDLNGEGLLVNLLDFQWVPLNSSSSSALEQRENYKVSPDGKYMAEISSAFTGHLAFRKLIEQNSATQERASFSVQNSKNGNFPVNGDSIVCYPLAENSPVENLFTEEQRTHPVDFVFGQVFDRQITIDLPEGYKVSAVPSNRVLVMEGGFLECSFSSAENNGSLALNFKFEIKEPFIPPQFYPDLKLFMETLKGLEKEKVVFKR